VEGEVNEGMGKVELSKKNVISLIQLFNVIGQAEAGVYRERRWTNSGRVIAGLFT